jgi:hypothetical protein
VAEKIGNGLARAMLGYGHLDTMECFVFSCVEGQVAASPFPFPPFVNRPPLFPSFPPAIPGGSEALWGRFVQATPHGPPRCSGFGT